ncbi:hypothetical protein BDF14DRAFT_1538292 [Spinellus fusiger]|nr:hypothetical protein BDF14DRAFT_1538292 [Spinellus fusiger]
MGVIDLILLSLLSMCVCLFCRCTVGVSTVVSAFHCCDWLLFHLLLEGGLFPFFCTSPTMLKVSVLWPPTHLFVSLFSLLSSLSTAVEAQKQKQKQQQQHGQPLSAVSAVAAANIASRPCWSTWAATVVVVVVVLGREEPSKRCPPLLLPRQLPCSFYQSLSIIPLYCISLSLLSLSFTMSEKKRKKENKLNSGTTHIT